MKKIVKKKIVIIVIVYKKLFIHFIFNPVIISDNLLEIVH